MTRRALAAINTARAASRSRAWALAGVDAPDYGTDWSTPLPVTYRVLGMNRTVELDIGYAIALESLPNCPFT